jgi:excisionase family DNA binding protein
MGTDSRQEITALISQLAKLMAEADRPEPTPEAPAPKRLLLTVAEAAEQLGIGKTKTYQLVRSSQLESVQIGRLRRVHVDAIARFAAGLAGDDLSTQRAA